MSWGRDDERAAKGVPRPPNAVTDRLFREVKLDRGRPMGMASQTTRRPLAARLIHRKFSFLCLFLSVRGTGLF
jgi:hypothetical protein